MVWPRSNLVMPLSGRPTSHVSVRGLRCRLRTSGGARTRLEGWLSRNLLDLKKINTFLVTDNFNINLNKKKFVAQFVYNNCLFSNEILKLTTNGKN